MTAGDRKSCFLRFVHTTAQDLLEDFQRQDIGGKRSDCQTEDRRCAHRVNVGDRVRRCNRTEQIRIVDDRREEVDGLRDRLVAADAQNRRVVVRLMTDEKIPYSFG